MTEPEFAALNAEQVARDAAEDPALQQACLDLMAERRGRAEQIHSRLGRYPDLKDTPLEAVHKVLGSPGFVTAFAEVISDPEAYCKQRVRKNLPRMLGGVERLADDANEDKRTRTSNLQWYLGVGGLSPTQKIEAGDDLMKVFQAIVGPSLKKAVEETP